ncbi:MAG: 5'-methylthioadenosine/adenosylhomocysteine nucleosidase [Prevotellaceae bacterium]|jgi:adenosylhomocysteine nucleosidase|nr:5'-methylthioadenosine/adenosylhomocysteine nucleosidase [Prevotellaceae bacterium]
MTLGIMGAMPEEIDKIIANIANKEIIERGGRLYYRGELYGRPVVAVFSRWGKVAAAATAANLILEFGVGKIVFTGVAGAISPELNVGDIVIGERLFQHDMDARPLMRRFEVPLTGKTSFETSEQNIQQMSLAIHNFLKNNKEFRKVLAGYGINNLKMIAGDIASGDLFISKKEMKDALIRNLPSVVCAEMEGAAVAQVCDDYNIPLIVVRVISDDADENAHNSAIGFIQKHAGDYSLFILEEYIKLCF